jgi:hypothetical protein
MPSTWPITRSESEEPPSAKLASDMLRPAWVGPILGDDAVDARQKLPAWARALPQRVAANVAVGH